MRRIAETSLVFVHIPKTAGQAVTAAFGLEHESSDHTLTARDDLPLMGPEFVRFCVVRDPVARFVSPYRYSVHMVSRNGKMPERRFIAEHGLDRDINAFVAAIGRMEFDLLTRPHFRPQTDFLRIGRPQIVLRYENLAQDIEIVRALAPERFVGLTERNVSKGRAAEEGMNTTLTDESEAAIRDLYHGDRMLLGYDRAGPAAPASPAPEAQGPETVDTEQ